MKSLSYYVLRQIIGPVALFILLMSSVVWLTQSLRLLALVISSGQSVGMFAYLSLLALPSMLNAIIPIAFFFGTLYALHKLNSDSELAVMWAAGFSRVQFAVPVLLAGALAMALTYLCSLYLMPLGQRIMKDKEVDIRADIGAAILKEGEFTSPSSDLTVFIREIDPGGDMHGILVYDTRNSERPLTYIAENGVMAQTVTGARLIMHNGSIQQTEKDGAQLSVLSFDQYVFNIDQYANSQRNSDREMNERYLPELFHPGFTSPAQDRYSQVFLAEAHNRLSSALYCLVFALIALASTAKGHMARMTYAGRLVAGAGFAISARMLGYAVQNWAGKDLWLIPALYLLPLVVFIIAGAVYLDLKLWPDAWKPQRMLQARPAE